MSTNHPIGIIELGNFNIKCIIFEINNNKVEIISNTIAPSEGMHNDTIVNLEKATNAIRSCIARAENKAKISLKKINLIFEQADFLCTKFSKHKNVDGSKIHKEDIEFLLNEAKKQLTHNDKKQSIIHIFNHNYVVDGKNFVEEPIDIYADKLSHEVTFITMPKNNLKNIDQVFVDCDIEIERLFSRIFALGVKLLNYNELKCGSAIFDLGSDKTSLGLFKNLALVHSITIPIGINHITKDISKVCSLDLEEAEKIRNDIDFSFHKNSKIFDENNYLKNTYFIKSNFRKISKKLILDVIKSRLDEILDSLKMHLIVPGFDLNSGISFLITGGGSNLLNIDKYFSNFFETNVKKCPTDEPQNHYIEKNFSSCLGAIKIIKEGWETEAIPETQSNNLKKKGFLGKIFGIN